MCKGEVVSSLFLVASIRLVQVIRGYGERRIILPEVYGFLENRDLMMCSGHSVVQLVEAPRYKPEDVTGIFC
jgi:hypothetical protein